MVMCDLWPTADITFPVCGTPWKASFCTPVRHPPDLLQNSQKCRILWYNSHRTHRSVGYCIQSCQGILCGVQDLLQNSQTCRVLWCNCHRTRRRIGYCGATVTELTDLVCGVTVRAILSYWKECIKCGYGICLYPQTAITSPRTLVCGNSTWLRSATCTKRRHSSWSWSMCVAIGWIWMLRNRYDLRIFRRVGVDLASLQRLTVTNELRHCCGRTALIYTYCSNANNFHTIKYIAYHLGMHGTTVDYRWCILYTTAVTACDPCVYGNPCVHARIRGCYSQTWARGRHNKRLSEAVLFTTFWGPGSWRHGLETGVFLLGRKLHIFTSMYILGDHIIFNVGVGVSRPIYDQNEPVSHLTQPDLWT